MPRFTVLVILFFTVFLQPFTLLAQWKAVYYRSGITDTIYSISKDKRFVADKAYPFPEYFYFDHTDAISAAVNCSRPCLLPSQVILPDSGYREIPVWYNVLPRRLPVKKDTTVISQRIYLQNIRQYTVWIYESGRGVWRRMVVEPEFQGFQLPFAVYLEKMKAIQAEGIPIEKDQVIITVVPADSSRSWQFVIGSFIAGERTTTAYPATHRLFSNLLSSTTPAYKPVPEGKERFRSNYFKEIPKGMGDSSLPSRISIVPLDDHSSDSLDRALLYKLLYSCIDNYLFYPERRLDKAQVKVSLENIFRLKQQQSYCELVDTLSRYITLTFDDLHFYIEKTTQGKCLLTEKAKAKSPVRVADIGNRFMIAANFDTASYRVHLNDEVLTIDGVPVQHVFDSMAMSQYGNNAVTPLKRSQLIAALLDRDGKDSCILTVRHDAGIETTMLRYNRKYTVPASFKPVQCEYRNYGDSVIYFRINAWEPPVYLQFINHWAELQKAGAVIIDLRGNGGGELMAAMQLFASFTERPASYFNFLTASNLPVPVVILPEKKYTFSPATRVVILGDAVTACASETFIRAMRHRDNTLFMSSVRSAGSMSSKFDIRLPSGIIVHTNSIQQKICYQTPEDVIESHGIYPDVTVEMNVAEDLRPYNDKLLKEAFKYLSADKRASPKTAKQSRQ